MGRRPTTGYSNEEIPDHLPTANQGAIPVVVRLVDDEHGEHYRPAEARRWNRTHVMAAIYSLHPATGRRSDTLAWLRAGDVCHSRRRHHDGVADRRAGLRAVAVVVHPGPSAIRGPR
jgi:hypothetical protein